MPSNKVLFLDDHDIDWSCNVIRIIHPGKKLAEPVISADQPWEDHLCIGGTVLKEDGKYRIWYQSYSQQMAYINLYAESDDGVVWHKPTLNKFEDFDGGLDNNIYLNRASMRSPQRSPLSVNQDHNQNILYTPHLGPEKTYTMLAYEYARSGYGAYDGYYLAYSKDGLHWTDGPAEPVIPGHGDVGWFIFDEHDSLFRGIVKTFLNIRGYSRRSVLWTESNDGINWSMPTPAVIPDEIDDSWGNGEPDRHTQFYGMPIYRYGPVLLGFLQDFRCTDGILSNDGSIDIQLVTSRDGRIWERVGDRTPIIGLGQEDGWDSLSVYSGNSFVEDGPNLKVFYSGCNYSHAWYTKDGLEKRQSIGLATWARDRLVGLRAGRNGGEIKIHLRGVDSEIHVNADASNGSIVAQLAVGGQSLDGKGFAECNSINQNSVDQIIRWNDGLPVLTDEVEITLKLHNAEIFAIWS